MANISSPLTYLNKREYGLIPDVKSQLFTNRLNAAKDFYRKDLVCHFGCVNAIEFSKNGELLVSGGDDRRVMIWQFGQAIMGYGRPKTMSTSHQSNIFCLGITSDNQKLYSGGNDDVVIVHDIESKSSLEVLRHQRAVCSLSIDPFNDRVVATAGNDGRLLLFDTRRSVLESMIVSRSRKAYHGVMFHPQQTGLLVSANARDGVALMDLRSTKTPLLRYTGHNGGTQNSMSVRFDSSGHRILALRRRMTPILYDIRTPEPMAEFFHQDYYNSCTMKSCSFAGDNDEYVMSGSDDFNLYIWKAPDVFDYGRMKHKYKLVETPHLVLYGHRSIVNQVRYNPHYCLIASSGVEKIIKVWSGIEYPDMRGSLLEETQGSDNPREIYTHEDYVSLVHHSGQMMADGVWVPPLYISHNYAEQSTVEDPRMMAFFDSLVQRELECLAEETDSLDGTSSGGSTQINNSDSDSSEELVVDDNNVRWSLPLPKRSNPNGARSQRCPNRLARLIASRNMKTLRAQKRGSARRSKQARSSLNNPSTSKCVTGTSTKGKRTPSRRTRTHRRIAPRTTLTLHSHAHSNGHAYIHTLAISHLPVNPRAHVNEHALAHAQVNEHALAPAHVQVSERGLTLAQVNAHVPAHIQVNSHSIAHALLSAPSSERTDSDEPSQFIFRSGGRMNRSMRRRLNPTRTVNKRKSKPATSYRRVWHLQPGTPSEGFDNVTAHSTFPEEPPVAGQPSTSSGFRGENTPSLFRIAEVDSDDDQSVASQRDPTSPQLNGNQGVPNNLVSIVPTPINGSRDSLGDSLREPPGSTSNASTPPPENRRNVRRVRRNGRISLHRSDSSESPPPKDQERASTSTYKPPHVGYNRTVARLMNETNESELESSCSTDNTTWPAPETMGTPDSGVGTIGTVGSSTRNNLPADEVSDDPEYQAVKFRQRVKKARRNYRDHMDSDSN